MNVHDGMHLEVITMLVFNDSSKMTKMNIHEGMHLEVTPMKEYNDYNSCAR